MKIHIADRTDPATSTCIRCGGSGHYHVRLGHPGQDHRELPNGRRGLRWAPRKGPYPCGACNATGQRRTKPVIKGRWHDQGNGLEPNKKPNPYLPGA